MWVAGGGSLFLDPGESEGVTGFRGRGGWGCLARVLVASYGLLEDWEVGLGVLILRAGSLVFRFVLGVDGRGDFGSERERGGEFFKGSALLRP